MLRRGMACMASEAGGDADYFPAGDRRFRTFGHLDGAVKEKGGG